MLKRTLLLLVFGLSLTGCNLSASSTQPIESYYEPYATHITIIPANLPPAWQQLPFDLITHFNQTEKNFLSSLINYEQPNQQIHFYWSNPPGQPTQQTIAINQTNFEPDNSIPSQLNYHTRQKFTFFQPTPSNQPTPLIPANAAISIHHITNNLPPLNQDDIKSISILHFVNLLSAHLPIQIYNQNNQLTIGENFNQSSQNSFNYSFSPSTNHYLDTLFINQIGNKLSTDYIDINSLNPQLIQTISLSPEYYNFTYSNNEISQQIFNQILQILEDQGSYETINKTLPDNTETSINQITPENIEINSTNQQISYYNFNQQIRYIIIKDTQITISTTPNPEIIPVISFTKNPALSLSNHLSNNYQFESLTFDPQSITGVIKI